MWVVWLSISKTRQSHVTDPRTLPLYNKLQQKKRRKAGRESPAPLTPPCRSPPQHSTPELAGLLQPLPPLPAPTLGVESVKDTRLVGCDFLVKRNAQLDGYWEERGVSGCWALQTAPYLVCLFLKALCLSSFLVESIRKASFRWSSAIREVTEVTISE